jgi:hypothetical protein
MPVQPIPEGFHTVTPYLMSGDPDRLLEFLKQAFGATELRRFDMPDGTIMHAEVRIGDSVIMIADGGGEWPPFPSWSRLCRRRWLGDVERAACQHSASAEEAISTGGGSRIPEMPGGLRRRL